MPHRFPPHLRVRRQRDIQRAFARGRRASDKRLRVWVVRNDRSRVRFGVSVGKKHGNAVRRNRLKRVVREAFRLSRDALPPCVDIICTPRFGVELSCADCMRSLTRLVKKAAGTDTAHDV